MIFGFLKKIADAAARFHSAGPRDVRDGRWSQGRGGRGSHPRQSTDAEMILFARSRQGPNPLGDMRRITDKINGSAVAQIGWSART